MLVRLVPPVYNGSDAHVRIIRLNLLKLSEHYNITVVCDDKSSTLHFPMKCMSCHWKRGFSSNLKGMGIMTYNFTKKIVSYLEVLAYSVKY